MSQPYFEVGEPVILACTTKPELNGEYTVINLWPEGRHLVEIRDNYEHWLTVRQRFAYELEGLKEIWFGESCLRKKYKRPDESFLDMLLKITDKADALQG